MARGGAPTGEGVAANSSPEELERQTPPGETEAALNCAGPAVGDRRSAIGDGRAKAWGRFCRYIVPLLLWMAFIFRMSTGVGSSHATYGRFATFLAWAWPEIAGNLTQDQLTLIFFFTRKAAHVLEYFILTLLAVRAAQQEQYVWNWRSARLAVLFAIFYSAADEWHQSFEPTRSSDVRDVLVDSVGVLLALGHSWLWYRGRRDPAAEIRRLAGLRSEGLLSDEEYRVAKARLLRSS